MSRQSARSRPRRQRIVATAAALLAAAVTPMPSHLQAEQAAPRGPAVFQISAEPPLELSAYDRHSLQQSCIERLPGLVAQLEPHPAHSGDYEAHMHVLASEPIIEQLERSPAAEAMIDQAGSTLQHGLHFWEQETMKPPLFQFLVMAGPPGPEVEMAGYPTDPRVLIQVYRKRGQRLRGRVEVLFEDHEPHSFDLEVEQVRAAFFHRTAQSGHDDKGRPATRFVRSPIWWSVDKKPPVAALTGASPALEILRLQLSTYTDACKRRLFEQEEKRFGRVDIQRLERPLWRLDVAENAVVIAVGSVWASALAREHGHRLTRAELTSLVNMDASGVAELLAQYPPTQKGMAHLLGTYTAGPMVIVNRLGQVLDP